MKPGNDFGRAGLRLSAGWGEDVRGRPVNADAPRRFSANPASMPRRASARCQSIPADALRPPSAASAGA
jgi:hypothetical protein